MRLYIKITLFFLLPIIASVGITKTAQQILVQGHLIQGGFLYLTLPKDAKLKVNGRTHKSHNNLAIIGIGRKDKKITLSVQYQGKIYNKKLKVKSKKYNIQKINVSRKYVSPPKKALKRIRADVNLAKKARRGYITAPNLPRNFIQPAKGIISGVYGSQRIFNGVPKRPHMGLDIAAKRGSPVYAPHDGKIILVSDMYYSGNTLFIDHGLGLKSSFLHLDKILVKVGQKVKQGDLVAKIGTTGRSTGPHLHWGMSVNNIRIDPAEFLKTEQTVWQQKIQ